MARFNTDVVFIDTSGQIRAVASDLTLRANESGGGHVIVGSGETLRPENDCRASDAIDLGIESHRWKTVFSCSGNFLDRPTVNGSGVLLQGETVAGAAGVDSINGLSGVVTLVSVNDAIVITENGQVIEFSGLFTTASGQLLEDIAGTLGSGVVNQLNSLTGIVDIVGVSGIDVSTSGQNILVGTNVSGLQTIIQNIGFSGLFNQVVVVETSDQSTNALAFQEALTLEVTVSGTEVGTYRIGWVVEGEVDSDGKQARYRVQIDDTETVMNIIPSFSEEDSPSIFAGFDYAPLGEGTHNIDLDFAITDTGVFNTIRNARLELWRVGDLNA